MRLQEALISLRGRARSALREGRRFRWVLDEIERTQWLTRAELRTLQLERTRALLEHAMSRVPYYRHLLQPMGLDAAWLRELEDVEALPLLCKATVASRGKEFLATGFRGPRFRVHTSGTTGSPLVLMQDLNAIVRENAFVWRQLLWAGLRFGERRAWLRGDLIVPSEQTEPPYWRVNRGENMLMMSSYHLSEASADAYLAALARFDPVLLQAYPSSIAYIARYLESRGRYYEGKSLRAIVTTSETLSEEDEELIRTRMGAKVFEQYGTAERVTMIQTCERGGRHIDLDYGLTELLPSGDGTWEIVGTGFNNWLMPLIRYRTGDLVALDPANARCACGRELPLVRRIYGRADDYVITSEGRRVGRLDHIFKGVANIAEAQIVQERIGELTLRVVPFGRFGKRDRLALVHNARRRLGERMRIEVEIVPFIPRTANGKFRAVVCKVADERKRAEVSAA